MDTSEAVLNRYLTYGGSYRTASKELGASKSLNYAKGASLTKPAIERVNTAGYSLTFSDSVGLMGPENYFVRFDLNIIDSGNNYVEEEGWTILFFSIPDEPTVNTYVSGTYDKDADNTGVINDYIPANFSTAIPSYLDSVIKVSLEDLKTNNHFVDSWVDARLYTKNRMEHPFDTMYVGLYDSFYVGVHARSTKRLPYNIKCTITTEIKPYGSLSNEEREYSAEY